MAEQQKNLSHVFFPVINKAHFMLFVHQITEDRSPLPSVITTLPLPTPENEIPIEILTMHEEVDTCDQQLIVSLLKNTTQLKNQVGAFRNTNITTICSYALCALVCETQVLWVKTHQINICC
jgi:hypothetical protein